MQREIKFRCWDKEDNIMITWKDFVETYFNQALISLNYENTNCPHLIWMQYTGLKDKNGKEIYEGDIVKDPYREVGFVLYQNGSFKLKATKILGFGSYSKYCEIIGNIYENPEILENEKV